MADRADTAQSSVIHLESDPLWYKDAIIYQMHVKAFFDANDDGIGDFAGLTQKLDYIQELGVNAIWLLPFYPSPQRDDGYDIADYLGVNHDYGSLDDFRRFVDEAHRRGLRVITELVINHTSDQHPWFQAARAASPGSPEREFYVWSDTDTKFAGTRIIFTDSESSNWAWDRTANAYYWHRFFSHQPDLNHNNPLVVAAVIDVMRFWLDLGVDGMRLDAIPYLCVREGTKNENLPETHAVLRQMRAVVDRHYQQRMFLAEANQWPEDVREYFGDGDECHMAYHFPLMPRIFMALALEDRYPIAEILRQTPDIPENCQWAIFLRNHDELTLEMVTDRERDYMYRMYAQEPRMRVNAGIRRRLATLLGNDVDRIKLMNSLLLSMPGSPIIYYGDEIGMGDNVYIGDRNGVRTPMQWSIDRNAGFSRADPQRLYLPLIMDPIYGYQAVNVETQSRDPSSLLNWTRRILAVRRQHKCFGRGTLEFVRPRNRKVFAYVRSYDGQTVLCVANLAQTAQAVELDLSTYRGRVPVELMGRNSFPPIGELPYFLTLPPHGFLWLLLSEDAPPPEWHMEHLPASELPVLVLPHGLATLAADIHDAGAPKVVRRTLDQYTREVLPVFMAQRRWFAQKAGGIERVEFGMRAPWRAADEAEWLLTTVTARSDDGQQHLYFLPLAIAWEDHETAMQLSSEWTIAKVREHARVGTLVDAFADPAFCLQWVEKLHEARDVRAGDGLFEFRPTSAFAELYARGFLPVQHLSGEQSNTGVVLGETFFLKAYRRLRPGPAPEIEMAVHLTRAGFRNCAALAGLVTLDHGSGPVTLMALFEFKRNQGDAWTYTLNHLERFATIVQDPDQRSEAHGLYANQIRTLGRRIGELHEVLARRSEEAAFRPEAVTGADLNTWSQEIEQEAEATFALLAERQSRLPEPVQPLAAELISLRAVVIDRIVGLRDLRIDGLQKTRSHGDLHLAQILLSEDDFIVTDFEGEPARSVEQRRRKHLALRDVAGMLRSFDYARAVALERTRTGRPDLEGVIEEALGQWYDLATDAFLAGYAGAVGDAGGWLKDSGSREMLLETFQIEKALYELRYELESRPTWVHVPLNGLITLVRAANRRGGVE
jgi:maltose alpha-D-glucosyltransferase/alpha-amylase